MPRMILVPKKASLHLQAGDSQAYYQVIMHNKNLDDLVFEPTFNEMLCYEVVPESVFNRYRLTSGEKFSELEGTISLKRSAIENADKAIGLLTYIAKFNSPDGRFSNDAGYSLDCELPARQFDELISAARQGRMPSVILVTVLGDGSTMSETVDLDWDNKEHQHLAVAEIGFKLPYISSADSDEYNQEDEEIAPTVLALQAQFEQLIRKIDEVRKGVMILVCIAIIAMVILSFHLEVL